MTTCGLRPISAVLIVKNGMPRLEAVLPPLIAVCDEVLLLDSGSTDGTLELARRLGCRVEHQDFLGYGPQKRRAVELARYDWVLSVDADEVLDAAAVEALRQHSLGDPRTAWRILRRTFVGSREVRYGTWTPDWCVRLFHRAHHQFSSAPVHESVAVSGPVATLNGSLLHYSFRDPIDLFARMGAYGRIKADRLRADGRCAGAMHLCARALWGFLRSYFFKRGFLDGRLGVVVALSVAVDAAVPLAQASLDEGG